MRIEPPLEKVSGNTRFPGWFFLFFLLIAGALLYLFFLPPAPAAPNFEVLQTESTKVYRPERTLWVTLKENDLLKPGENVQSWPEGSARLRSGENEIFLKENTSLRFEKPGIFDRGYSSVIILERGFLRVTAKSRKVKIIIPGNFKLVPAKNALNRIFPRLNAGLQNAEVLLSALPEYSRHEISVAEGSAEIIESFPWKRLKISKGQKAEWLKSGPESKPSPETSEEKIQTAPLTAPKNLQSVPASNSERLTYDLSKGVSFSTKSGKSEPTFGIEPETGDAFLELTYDVLQPSALAGVNFPAEEIEISRFHALQVQFQKVQGRGSPEAFRIEFKSGDRVIRVFTGTLKIEETWQAFSFPLKFQAPSKISEISLLFSNGKVGASKEGSLRIKNLSLE